MNCEKGEKKRECLMITILSVLLFTGIVDAQNVDSNNEEISKATEIIENSRKALGLGKEKLNIQTISLNYSVSIFVKEFIKVRDEKRERQGHGEREIHTTLPNKSRYEESMTIEDTDWITKFVLDEKLIDYENYGIWEGKRYENDSPNSNKLSKEQLINEKKTDLIFILFPVLLESSDLSLRFRYIGKAELNNGKADVLEADMRPQKRVRLFFGETSQLLNLLTIESKLPSGTLITEKKYFSDYKIIEGLKIANKIISETKESNELFDRESFEEQELKSVKVNPSFKDNFFEVKKK